MSKILEIKVTDILESCPPKYIHTLFLKDGTEHKYSINDTTLFEQFPHPEDVALMTAYNTKQRKKEDKIMKEWCEYLAENPYLY